MEFWPVPIRLNRSRTGGKPVRNRPRDQSAAAPLFRPILSDRVWQVTVEHNTQFCIRALHLQ
eukprot:2563696-Rhodomonas_salina.1